MTAKKAEKKAVKRNAAKASKTKKKAAKKSVTKASKTKKNAAAKSGKVTKAKKPQKSNGKANRSKPPEHRDIVELAVQLVSAQIHANAQYDSSMQLMHEVRQLALDIVDSIKNVPLVVTDGSEDLMLRIGIESMAATRRRKFRAPRNRMLEPLSHPDLDRLFQSALRRAFVMLNAPFDTERVVFAEQIFTASEQIKEGAIRRRFMDFRWPDLKSGDPVIRLMRDVNRWFTQHLIDLRASDQSLDGKELVSALWRAPRKLENLQC